MIVTHAYDWHGHACASHDTLCSCDILVAWSWLSPQSVLPLSMGCGSSSSPFRAQARSKNASKTISFKEMHHSTQHLVIFGFPFVFICSVISALRPGYYAKNAPVAYHDHWPYTEHGGPCGRWQGPECTSVGHPEIRGIGTGCDHLRKTRTTTPHAQTPGIIPIITPQILRCIESELIAKIGGILS